MHGPTIGDSTVVAPTYAAMREIYDSAGSPIFSLVKGNTLGIVGSIRTELQATFMKGALGRIVAGASGSEGEYAVEYYFRSDSLLISVESFE